MSKYYWLNKDSKAFLKRGYLETGETPEQRVLDIAKSAEKYLKAGSNPPIVKIEFFDDIKNLERINCYSNELDTWGKSKIVFLTKQIVEVKLKGKFIGERGRINCSLKESNGYWRWLGIQFVISEE